MLKNNKIKLLIIAIVMLIISFIFILINGKTYIYKINLNSNVDNINDIKVVLDQRKEVLTIIDKKINNNQIEFKLKGLNKGYAFIDVQVNDESFMEKFYVHSFGIITQNHYLGRCSGDILIQLLLIIYTFIILILLIKKYRINMNDNIYQYKNVTYLGIIIFMIMMFINMCLQMVNYQGLINSIHNIIGSVSFFSIIIFPIAIIVSILVIISNIVLMKKEGFTWKNMLGIILGIFLIVSTLIPDIIYNYIHRTNIIDIFNEKGIGLYIYTFIETFIYTSITYLECILLGTIILSVKAARKIPIYDKDYIIILGCMIKKDGTLTPLLKSRVDRAIAFAKMQKDNTNKSITFIPSGGKGSDEIISEAEAIKKYLIKKGIKQSSIIIEDKSTNTYENIRNSYKLIKDKNKKIAFSTTNYHVFRAGIIATDQNIKIEGIGSKTKSYFWINAFIREFIATLYSEKKKHVKIISVIMIICIILIMAIHISNSL